MVVVSGWLLTGSASVVVFLSNRPPSAASTSLVIVILLYSPPVLSTNMDAGSKPLKTTPRAHPKTGRKVPPGRRPSIDLLDPSTTTSATDLIAGSVGALLNDSTIPDYIRAIISLLLEERKRHITILEKLRELSDDNGLLRAANLNVRSMLAVSQDQSSQHTPGSFERSSLQVNVCDCAERKERARSVIFANIQESCLHLPSERVQDDFQRVRFILDFLGVDCPVIAAYRLGRFNARRPRLIKVLLPSSIFASLTVKRAPRLKHLHWQRHPFVRPSLPKEEREKLKHGQGARHCSSTRNRSSSVTSEISTEVLLTADRVSDSCVTRSIVSTNCSPHAVTANLNI